jgi:hypothetical protein
LVLEQDPLTALTCRYPRDQRMRKIAPNRPFDLTRRGARNGRASTASFDDFVGPPEQRLRDGKAERLRGLEVDYQLEPGRLLYRQIDRQCYS